MIRGRSVLRSGNLVRIRPRPTPEERVRFWTRILLAAGFAAAVVIYATAPTAADNPLGYDPLQNKAYLHELEVFGGKANVLMAEFRDWFESLWHGRRLAFTVAALAVLTAGAIRFTFILLRHPPEDAEAAGEDSDGGTSGR